MLTQTIIFSFMFTNVRGQAGVITIGNYMFYATLTGQEAQGWVAAVELCAQIPGGEYKPALVMEEHKSGLRDYLNDKREEAEISDNATNTFYIGAMRASRNEPFFWWWNNETFELFDQKNESFVQSSPTSTQNCILLDYIENRIELFYRFAECNEEHFYICSAETIEFIAAKSAMPTAIAATVVLLLIVIVTCCCVKCRRTPHKCEADSMTQPMITKHKCVSFSAMRKQKQKLEAVEEESVEEEAVEEEVVEEEAVKEEAVEEEAVEEEAVEEKVVEEEAVEEEVVEEEAVEEEAVEKKALKAETMEAEVEEAKGKLFTETEV